MSRKLDERVPVGRVRDIGYFVHCLESDMPMLEDMKRLLVIAGQSERDILIKVAAEYVDRNRHQLRGKDLISLFELRKRAKRLGITFTAQDLSNFRHQSWTEGIDFFTHTFGQRFDFFNWKTVKPFFEHLAEIQAGKKPKATPWKRSVAVEKPQTLKPLQEPAKPKRRRSKRKVKGIVPIGPFESGFKGSPQKRR